MGNAGFVSFSKTLLVRLIESFPEKKIIEMAEYVSGEPMVDRMYAVKGEYTLESFLGMIEDWAGSNKFPLRKGSKDDLTTYTIQLDLSRNWSVYFAHIYKNVIENLTGKKVAIDTTGNTVWFQF